MPFRVPSWRHLGWKILFRLAGAALLFGVLLALMRTGRDRWIGVGLTIGGLAGLVVAIQGIRVEYRELKKQRELDQMQAAEKVNTPGEHQ